MEPLNSGSGSIGATLALGGRVRMIALAEGQKTPAGSVPEGFRWDQNGHRISGVYHAGPVRLLVLVGCARGIVPSPPGKAKSRPMQGRDPQCLVLVALELDVGLVGRVIADHELLDLRERVTPIGEALEVRAHRG